MPTQALKQMKAKQRQPLYRLVAHAYQLAQSEEADIEQLKAIGFSQQQQRQAAKYQRYQFTLEKLKPWGEASPQLQSLFSAVFEENTQAYYSQLRQQHPDGVECWVNQADAKPHPMLENQMMTTLFSIETAAHQLIHEIYQKRLSLEGKEQRLDRQRAQLVIDLNCEKARVIQAIEALPTDLELDEIQQFASLNPFQRFFRNLFRLAPKHPFEQQYKQADQAIKRYQRYCIAQLAQFGLTPGQHRVENSAYKKLYKRFAQTEQRLKLSSAAALPPSANYFNQDIFVLLLAPEDSEQACRYQYHDRHYYLTTTQAEQHNLSSDTAIATATAHTPELLLANYACYENGHIDEDGKPIIDTLGVRNGSHSPVIYHKQSEHEFNNHEASWLAFSNMEQALLNCRIQVIEQLLTTVEANIKLLRVQIAQQINNTLHQALISTNGQELTTPQEQQSLIETALSNQDQTIINLLKINYKTVFNPQLFHTHLITASGVGSLSEQQRQQFLSARLAQYATQTQADGTAGGLSYFTLGVNSMRYDTFSGESRHLVKRNNCVAMVDLTLNLLNSVDGEAPLAINGDDKAFYLETKKAVQKVAGKYYAKIKSDYLPKKRELLEVKSTLKQIAQRRKLIDAQINLIQQKIRLYSDQTDSANKTLSINTLKAQKQALLDTKRQLSTKRRELVTKKSNLNSELNAVNEDLNNSRDRFRQLETQLLDIANNINQSNYQQVQHTTGLQGHWAAYQLIQELFTGSTAMGLDNWKSESNNGLLQSLIQWVSGNTNAFASMGCKSANDRALFIALLVNELSKKPLAEFKAEENETIMQTMDRVQRLAFKDNALTSLPFDISNHQTQKDRSAMPKTNDSILISAGNHLRTQFSKLSHRLSVAKWAAHKRQKDGNNVAVSQLRGLATQHYHSPWTLLYNLWQKAPGSDKYSHLTKHLESKLSYLHSLNPKQQQSRIENLKRLIQSDTSLANPHKQLLNNWLQLISLYQSDNKAQLIDTIQEKLKTLKASCEQNDHRIHGAGHRRLIALLADCDIDGLDELACLKKMMACQSIATFRTNDWTAWKDNLGFLGRSRPQWLTNSYHELARAITLPGNAASGDNLILV